MVHQPVSYSLGFSSARRHWVSALSRAGWVATAALACSFVTTTAQAHIELTEPIARYEVTGVDTGIKGCPCGLATGGGNSNRTCNVQLDGSDPNRDGSRALTVPAGSMLTLKFDETIGHAGKYRVAFDPEGADFFDFNDHVLTEVDDPQGNNGNAGGMSWEIDVTLPNTPCTSCTLQLIQVMEPNTLGGTVDGARLADMSTYYTCIDLVLTGGASETGETGAETTSSVDTSSSAVTSEPGEDTFETDISSSSVSTQPGSSSATAAVTSAPPVPPPVTSGSTAGPTTPGAPPALTSSSQAPITAAPGPSTAASTTTDVAPMAGENEGSGCAVSQPPRGAAARSAWMVAVALLLGARRKSRIR
jgi:hypothetical protein